MTIAAFTTDIARSIGFLSRLPVPDRFFDGHDGSMAQMVRAFPAAGFLLSIPAALAILLVLGLTGKAVMAALIGLAIQTAITGALHEDGLTDTADGLGSRGDRARALEIMRDSRIGTYGAVALVFSLALRVTSLALLFDALGPLAAAALFCALGALSRAALVWHWYRLAPARNDGVAAASGTPFRHATMVALSSGVLLFLVVGLIILPLGAVVFSGMVVALAILAFTRHVDRRLGGHTGDTLGASQQIAEIGALTALALFI